VLLLEAPPLIKMAKKEEVKKESQIGINYKNIEVLKKYLSSRYKILPRKVSGLNSKNQRKLMNEVKKARIMALLPFTDRHALR
jgi:ribosomal protein S18